MGIKHKGLTFHEAKVLLNQHGENKLKDANKISVFKQVLDQFLNPLILILIAVAIISLLLKEYVESIVIMAVVFMNAAIGLAQENKAVNAVESIKQLISLKSKVLRNGSIITIPADGKLIHSKSLQINEAQLTGESYPVEKGREASEVFMSSIVTSGRGYFQVERTGMTTEIGKITSMVSKKSGDRTPLEAEFKLLTKKVLMLTLVTSTILFIVGIMRGFSFYEMFKASVSLGVSTIPEGLPVVVTITLAIGVYRISKKQAVIKNLPSASTLASIDTVCTDKTGTITEGKILLKNIYKLSDKSLEINDNDIHIQKLCILCNDGVITDFSQSGDLLDLALLNNAKNNQINIDQIRKNYHHLDEIPFDSDRQPTPNFGYYS